MFWFFIAACRSGLFCKYRCDYSKITSLFSGDFNLACFFDNRVLYRIFLIYCRMKHLFLYVVYALSCCMIGAQEGKPEDEFILHGVFNGSGTQAISISYFDRNAVWVEDTAKIADGTFEFRGSVIRPTLVTIQGNTLSGSVDDPDRTIIFIEPGVMRVRVTEHDFKNAVTEGSKSQALLDTLNVRKKDVEASRKPVAKAYAQIKSVYAKGDTSVTVTEKMESLRRQLLPFQHRLKTIDLNFVETYSDAFVSAYVLGYYTGKISRDSLAYYYNRLSDVAKNNKYGRDIRKVLVADEQPVAMPGSVAPQIGMRDIDGQWVSLESFRSEKYVLLDFWASWCIPCVRMNPQLKKIYETYTDRGLDIISLSLDHNRDAWENEIRKSSLNAWTHILIGFRGDAFDEFRKQYGLTTIPLYILIDKEGTIVGRYDKITEDGALLQKLGEIFE